MKLNHFSTQYAPNPLSVRVICCGPMGFTEETCTCPIREEVNPSLNVLSCLLIDGDVVVDGSNSGAEVNEAPKEYSSWGHNLASKC